MAKRRSSYLKRSKENVPDLRWETEYGGLYESHTLKTVANPSVTYATITCQTTGPGRWNIKVFTDKLIVQTQRSDMATRSLEKAALAVMTLLNDFYTGINIINKIGDDKKLYQANKEF